MNSPGVVVLGDLVTDVVTRLRGPVAVGSDAAADITMSGGGSGANVAAWLASLGTPVTFIGKVGEDPAGAARTAELADTGVRLAVAVDTAHPTGTVVVLVDPAGERTMLPDRGANLHLRPHEIPAELFQPGAHLHLSGYALLDEGPRAAALRALDLARQAEMTISVDPSSARPLSAMTRSFVTWTAGADLCLPNLAEATVLTGCSDPAQAATRLTTHYQHVVVTLGAAGAMWSDGIRQVNVDAPPVTVRDTTGAGDAFTAGFLSAYLQGADVEQRLQQATQTAAQAVVVDGARPRARPR